MVPSAFPTALVKSHAIRRERFDLSSIYTECIAWTKPHLNFNIVTKMLSANTLARDGRFSCHIYFFTSFFGPLVGEFKRWPPSSIFFIRSMPLAWSISSAWSSEQSIGDLHFFGWLWHLYFSMSEPTSNSHPTHGNTCGAFSSGNTWKQSPKPTPTTSSPTSLATRWWGGLSQQITL